MPQVVGQTIENKELSPGTEYLNCTLRGKLSVHAEGEVTVKGGTLIDSAIVIEQGSPRNVRIEGVEMRGGLSGLFHNNSPAVFQANDCDGLTVTKNKFRDFRGYGMILFGCRNLDVFGNDGGNLHQFAHILKIFEGCRVRYNKLSGMIRMGFEMQRHGGSIARDLVVEGNVVMDWRLPFRDSFGLSIVPDQGVNTKVLNNYIRGVPRGWTGQWNPEADRDGQGRRMGYGIEYGAMNGEVSGNVVGGAFANHIIISGGGGAHNTIIPVKNNKLYGSPMWNGYITTESTAGPGFGFRDENNVKDGEFGNMPGPEAALLRIAEMVGNPIPPPPPPPPPPVLVGPSDLAAKGLTHTTIGLKWVDNSLNEGGFRILRKSTNGTDPYVPVVDLPPNTVEYVDRGLVKGWRYNYKILAFLNDVTADGPPALLGIQTNVDVPDNGQPPPPPPGAQVKVLVTVDGKQGIIGPDGVWKPL